MVHIAHNQWGPEDGGSCEFQWAQRPLEVHCLSDVGKRRPHNEDSCLLCVPEAEELTRLGVLVAVADGMGGASAGEHASHLALQSFAQCYYSDQLDRADEQIDPLASPETRPAVANDSCPQRMKAALEYANRHVFAESQGDPLYHGMGTTFSAAVVAGNVAYVSQVGDSRVYIHRPRVGLIQVTDDHSLVAEQVRNGYISEADAQGHSLKNLITRAVGIKDEVDIDLFAVRLRRGDTLFLCSDGLSNVVPDNKIEEAMDQPTLSAIARSLVGWALKQGGPDNITACLLRLTDTPEKATVDAGAHEVAVKGTGLWNNLKRLFR